MTAAESLAQTAGRAPACRALGIPRASFYRGLGKEEQPSPPAPRPTPARALALPERQAVLGQLHSERFQDN